MSDHLDVYDNLKHENERRQEAAQGLTQEMQALDRGFRETIAQWLQTQEERIEASGYADEVSLRLEDAQNGAASGSDWQRLGAAWQPGSHKLRYFIAYRPRVVPNLTPTYLLVFTYAFEDLGGALQLIRIEAESDHSMAEMFPRILGEGEDGRPVYAHELPDRLDEMLNLAAADYREQAMNLGQPLPPERQITPLGNTDSGLIGTEPPG